MKRLVVSFVVMALLVAAGFACAVESMEKNAFSISKGKLIRKEESFQIRAVQLLDLADLGKTRDDLDKAFVRLSEVGFNAVCMGVPGSNAKGTDIAKPAVQHIVDLVDETCSRRMGAIIRPFDDKSPVDPVYRKALIDTIGRLFKAERRALYLITGPDSEVLAAALRKAAPQLVVVAEKGGSMDLITDPAAAKVGHVCLLAGMLPPKDKIETMSFLVPNKDEFYSELDKALANPVESATWTPDNSMLSEAERKEGFVSLFNGKNLDGWYIWGQNKKGFGVVDKHIEWLDKGGGALYSRERYDNFVLRLEWKIKKDGNSGLYLRAPRSNRQSMTGMEIQIQGDHGKPITDQSTTSIYSVVAPKVDATKPEGQWNEMEVTLNGGSLKVVLNGQVTQEVNLDENPVLKNRLRKGFIGLQDHDRYVAYRNIRIKKL